MKKNELVNIVRSVLEVLCIILLIMLTIGFFNTPFDNGKAVIMSKETLAEQKYVEKMSVSIEKFTEQVLEIKETNEQANANKIVPLKMSQIYSNIFSEMSDDYNSISAMEVPERFKQFHVSYLKAMEYQGAALNEVLVYLKDGEKSHLSTIDKYNASFVTKYNDAINLFNRLLEEKTLK